MIKNYIFALALVAMPFITACSDDDPVTSPAGDPELGVRSIPSSFDIYWGTVTLEVVSEDLDKEWKISTDDSWIILGEPDYDKDTFTVTVKGAENAGTTTGTIKLTAEGAETVEIPITQSGLGAYLDRNTRQLMNLRGKVKSLDEHYSITLLDYMYGMIIMKFDNVTFDENGMLAGIGFVKSEYTSRLSNITYDSQNRLRTYDYQDGATGITFAGELVYDNGDLYFSTEEFFQQTIGMQYMGIESKTWMPYMIKGFSEFRVKPFMYSLVTYPSAVCRLRSEDNRTFDMYLSIYDDNGDLIEEDPTPWNSFYIEDGYTKHADYPSMLGPAFMVLQRNFYDVDIPSGMLKRYETAYYTWQDPTEMDEVWFYTDNSLNRTNSTSSIYYYQIDDDYVPYTVESKITYNQFLDPVRIENFNATDRLLEISYVYDEFDNWTEMKITSTGGESGTQTDTYTRTITYYQ